MFINLWNHTCYSLLSSTTRIDDLIQHAIDNKQKYVAMIDRDNMYGSIEFYHACKKKKLVPIIGLQIEIDGQQVLLFALNNKGFHNLVKISSFILTKKDKIQWNWTDYVEDVVVIVNDVNNYSILKKHKHFYSYEQKANNPIAIKECFCQTKEDLYYLDILYCLSHDLLYEDMEDDKKHQEVFLDPNHIKKIFSEQALKNLDDLLSLFNLDLDLNKQMHFTKYNEKYKSIDLLKTHCKEGLKQRLTKYQYPNYPLSYINQLKYELEVIEQMNFADYFLVVQDYVNFAKQNGILVGPGRGSAVGSLISYLLGITAIDPIQYGLIFERFLNPSRKSMPDIDVDFLDERRQEVFNYMFERYGYEKAAHIITFQTIKVKSAIKDAGRVLGYNFKTLNQITDRFPEEKKEKEVNVEQLKQMIESNKSLSTIAKQYKELFDVVFKIIGIPRQIGIHASGVVAGDQPLWNLIPVATHSDGTLITQYPMKYLEAFGLIKMDILSSSNLAIIDKTIKLIANTHKIKIDITNIPLDNNKVFEQLSSGDTVGIFQFESDGMTNLMTKIKPRTIEDLSIVSSLYRPGPKKNINTYIENRNHPDKIKYLNDDFKKILSPTFNIIIYQEQVIEIAKQIGDFNNVDADNFRRAISKKDSTQLAKFKTTFIKNGKQRGYSDKQLEEYYEYILNFGEYGFNHSHAIAYAYVSYWLAYLKTMYPLEFLTTLLNNCNGAIDKIKGYAQYLKTKGIKLLPPSINKSQFEFSVHHKDIVFGLNAVKGLGISVITKIITARERAGGAFKDYQQAIKALNDNGIGLKTIETLIKVGAFDCVLKDKTRYWLLTNYESFFEKIVNLPVQEVEINEEINRQLEQYQYELIGLSFNEHPLTKIKANYLSTKKIVDLNKATTIDQVFNVIVTLTSLRAVKTKTGLDMAFLTIEDDTYLINKVALFPGLYTKLKPVLTINEIYTMTIKPNAQGYQLLAAERINK